MLLDETDGNRAHRDEQARITTAGKRRDERSVCDAASDEHARNTADDGAQRHRDARLELRARTSFALRALVRLLLFGFLAFAPPLVATATRGDAG